MTVLAGALCSLLLGTAPTEVLVVPPIDQHGRIVDAGDVETNLFEAVAAAGVFSEKRTSSAKEVMSRLHESGQDCAISDVTCFVQLGQYLDAHLLLVTHVEPPSPNAVEVKLIDVDKSTVVKAVSMPLRGDAKERAARVRLAVLTVLIDDLKPALLRVKTNDGAKISLDGVEVGVAPWASPSPNVLPGDHQLTVTAIDGRSAATQFFAEPGTVVNIELPLPAEKVAPPVVVMEKAASTSMSPLVLTGGVVAGVGAAGLLAFGGSAVVANASYSNVDAAFEDRRATFQALPWLEGGSYVSLGVAIVGGALLTYGLVAGDDAPDGS